MLIDLCFFKIHCKVFYGHYHHALQTGTCVFKLEINTTIFHRQMESDICEHPDKEDSVCISCGMCFETQTYEDSWARSSSTFTPRPYMRYSIADTSRSFDAAIGKILVPLGLECYKTQIKSILGEKKFKSRLNKEDKIIVTLLHILKQHSFPILLSDLLKYSSISKSKILKAHRDTFGFLQRSEDYLRRTYERTLDFLGKLGVQAACTFEEYAESQKNHITSEPGAFCLAFVLEHACVPQRLIRTTTEYNLNQIKSIRRKLKKQHDV